MIDFNLGRKVPNIMELRAYLYQIISQNFGMSHDLIEKFKKNFPQLIDNIDQWDLNILSESDMRRVLKKEGLLPDEIFYFTCDYKPDNSTSIDYKTIPELYTRVRQVSFDFEGLIVLECFNSQIYKLFNSRGECLWDSCHNLDLGLDGKVLLRSSKNDGGFWRLMQYNGNYLEDIGFFGPSDSPIDFSFIGDRDLIPEMFPIGEYKTPKTFPAETLSDEEVIHELTADPSTFRGLTSYYYDNKTLSEVAVNSSVYAFTLLSKSLQEDKDFVIRLITDNENLQRMYSFLNDQLKKDKDIIGICLSSIPEILKNIAPVSDKKLIFEALAKESRVIEWVAIELLEDRSFVLDAVKINGNALYFLDDKYKADKEVVIEAVKSKGKALQYATIELRGNKDIILQAVKQSKWAIEYASEELKNDKEFLDMIKNAGFVYNETDDLPF